MSQDTAIFVGVVDAEGVIHFDFPRQQINYCKRALAGQPVDVMIAKQGHMRSKLQNAAIHAMLTPWAREEGHRIEDLKRDLLRAVFGEIEHVNPITGEVEKVLAEPHTSKLNRAQFSELIERSLDIAAECGFVLIAPNEYRERKEQAARKRAKTEAA